MQRTARVILGAQGCVGCPSTAAWPSGIAGVLLQQPFSSNVAGSGGAASSLQRVPTPVQPPPPPPGHGRLLVSAAAAAAAIALGTTAVLSANPAEHQRATTNLSSKDGSAKASGWLERFGGVAAERHHDPPRSSAQTQSAVATCLVSPLLYLLRNIAPSAAELSQRTTAAAAQAAFLEPWELTSVLWGWASLGAEPAGQLLSPLTTQAASALQHLPLYEAIACAWALYLLQDVQPLPQGLWTSLLARVAEADPQEMDEACTLYMLECAMQQASLDAAAVGPGQGLPPRASASEVEALLRTLPKRTRSRVMEAHHSYVPMQPYIEGAYMTVLHLMKILPSLTEAAAAAPASVYGKAFGQLGPADAARAQAVAADARQLSRIKRELAWHWRQDELLDQRQRVLNQVAYILTRRLGQHIQQPPDIDVLLPQRRLALFVEDVHGLSPMGRSTLSPEACGDALRLLLRDNFAPGRSGFARKQLPGPALAKTRCLLRRGWACAVLEVSDEVDNARLEAQLRRVLQDN